jgi:hypothetical protein
MAEDILTPFFTNFFTPKYLGDFRGGLKQVKVLQFPRPDAEPVEILLKPYPFMTLYDIKVLLYQQLRKEISAHPSFQCLLLPLAQLENTGNEENLTFNVNVNRIAKEYMTFDYSWAKPETTNAFTLIDPFSRVSGTNADPQFVSDTGKRTLSFPMRARMTVEDFMRDIDESGTLTLHLYLYKDVVGGLATELRTSEREWFGRISPYFPDLEINQSSTTLSEKQTTRIRIFDAYVSNLMNQMTVIDTLLEEGSSPLLNMVVAGVKSLRLLWVDKPGTKIPLETLFYKLDVTHERPFLRILPAGTTAVTKLKMDGTFKIPDISDPRLLRIWKDERNPKPDTDFLFSKLIIRRSIGTQPALYGTLRMFDNNSADFVIIPPKQLRLLDPRSDLSALGSLLTEGLKGTPYSNQLPEIGEASIICAIRLALTTKLMNSETLRKRLQSFSSLFQEIPPLPGDKPLLMLRYRAVSNYASEDKLYTFLTLLISRTLAKGEAAMPELVVALEKEFQLSKEEAQTKVAYWLRNRGDIELAVPETKDYIMTYNPGIDIAIFGQQSYYTIHMYRVDSKEVFQRIITAISLLLSGKDSDFTTSEEEAVVVTTVANAVTVRSPGSNLPSSAVADALVELPENAVGSGAVTENGLNNANAGDDLFQRLMMGAPVAQGEDEDGVGDFEVINLGNVENENAQQVAEAGNVRARVEENARNANAAAARTLVVPAPQQREQVRAEVKEEEEEEVETGKKKKSYQGWVKSQLQIADQRLFQYDTDVGGRKIKKYVTMCQATESRQPFVLNQEQFDVMRETYASDGDVMFVVYPLEQGEALPQVGDEVYTLLKYGTNPLKQNYYLCCQFFCTKDYIMVREKDFYSTTDRQGRPKPGESSPGKKDNGSCPFCHKLEIKVLKSPGANEAVIQRRSKKGDDKRHLYVGFLQGETQHPEEFYMPCCFTEDTPLYSSDTRFDKVRGEEEEKEEEEVRTIVGVPTTSYQITMYRAHKKYIVGPEKEFLKISEIDGPQIGLLPPIVDKYFAQEPKDYVSREANKMELLPNAKCFLRVGVENRGSHRYDSFFAALAPYLDYRNNAEQVKARIKEVITPRIFTFLNYGNLVLEFYDPGDPAPSDADLRTWVNRELQIDLSPSNKDAALRIWKSYHHFLGFLDSPQVKEYRQFAQMLALPGLVATRGLILIVLELNQKNELSIRCPPFGYNVEQYSSSDVGFILHRSSGIWEPIFYSLNKAETPRFKASHQPEITFQRGLEAGWPAIVKQRVVEFSSQCYSMGRSIYTSSRSIDPMALIPVSRAIEAMPTTPVGVVRDTYNHVVALTFRAVPGKPGLVALPVIDDEYMPITRTIHLDWDDYTPAPMDLLVKYYKQTFQNFFALYPKYRIKRRIKSNATGKYVAVQLENRLFIPAAPPKNEADIADLALGMVDEMEWSMNRDIYWGKTEDEEDSLFQAKESDMMEIFEHLRLTFSNWFTSKATSPEFRTTIKKIIDARKLPLFERRKRLEVLLGPTILSWMDTTKPKGEQEASLLRVDCRLQTEAPCPARCVWRQEAGNNVGACYLHSPKNYRLGGRMVNGPKLLMMRLLEELLRFPERKVQLLTGSVPHLVTLKEAVKIGEQYVLPENSLAWQDLLRLDWVQSGKEQKKYFEEMSRNKRPVEESKGESEETKTETETETEETTTFAEPLPASLKELFGATDPKLQKLVLLKASVPETVPPLNPYLSPLGTGAGQLGMDENAAYLDNNAVKRLTLFTRRPILYIDMLMDPPEVLSYGVMRKQKTPIPYILVSTEDGPRVLSSSKSYYQDVKPEDMPIGLFTLYDERTGISE